MHDLIAVEKIAQWEKLKALVLDSVSSPITKRVYNMALNEFMAWFQQAPRPGFTKATVSAWRVSLEARGLGSSSIIIRMSAIRKLAAEAADNGLLAPELAAGISRVKSAKTQGIRVGKPEWYVFPAGRGQPNDPTSPVTTLKTAWTKVRKNANVVGRWHDNRHTLVTELAESGAGDEVIMSIAGHVSRAMLSRYSHVRMEAKRRALDEIAVRQRTADEKRLKEAEQLQLAAAACASASVH